MTKKQDARIERIANKIVTRLFRVYEGGTRYTEGQRIAVMQGVWPDEKSLGGWCKKAAIREISEVLNKSMDW